MVRSMGVLIIQNANLQRKRDFMEKESITSFLEKYDVWFNLNKASFIQQENKDENLLIVFLNKFNSEYVKNMPIDDYVVGKGGDSFCKWVETDLQDYGDIHAKKLNAWQKFSIYYNSKTGHYDHGAKFGRDEQTVYKEVRKAVVDVIEAAKTGDYDTLALSKLNPLFKNKIFYLYNKTESIPIYSEKDINTLLTIFSVPFNEKFDRAYKRKLLFDFYKSLDRDDITPYRFMKFVFNELGYRPILRTNDANKLNSPVSGKTYSLVDVEHLEDIVPNRPSSSTRTGLVSEKPESVAQKKITGKKGEEIVKAYILSHKNELEITGEVDCACEYNDFKHYDFAYRTNEGRTIYVEVKATKGHNVSNINFEMSDKEYNFMKENIDNYFFFYIDDVFNGDIIKRISARCIVAKPSKYKIAMNITE